MVAEISTRGGGSDRRSRSARCARPGAARDADDASGRADDLQLGKGCRQPGPGVGPRTADPDGTPARPFGRVPDQVSLEQAQASARLVALSVIAGVQRAVGDLDRITGWLTVSGFVQAQPGYPQTTVVMNAFSQLILDVFGTTVGEHARTAIGVVALPLNLPVVVAAELQIA